MPLQFYHPLSIASESLEAMAAQLTRDRQAFEGFLNDVVVRKESSNGIVDLPAGSTLNGTALSTVAALDDLSDVTELLSANRHVLVHNGAGQYVNRVLVEADVSDLQSYLLNVVEDTTPQLGGDLDLNGFNIDFPTTANISDVIDDDTMATASATKLATSESIKAYVDNALPFYLGEDNDVDGMSFSSTSTSYVDVEHSASVPVDVDVTKKLGSSDSDLLVRWGASLYITGAGGVQFGIHDGSADNDGSKCYLNAANDHQAFTGIVRLTGLAAGAHTLTLRVKRTAGSGTMTWDGNDYAWMTVEEVPV